MAWAIITIYTSKCAQMDPQQLSKTSKFYSRCKKCDIRKTLGGGTTTPLGSPKVKRHCQATHEAYIKIFILFARRRSSISKCESVINLASTRIHHHFTAMFFRVFVNCLEKSVYTSLTNELWLSLYTLEVALTTNLTVLQKGNIELQRSDV